MNKRENLLSKILRLREEIEIHNKLYYLENNPIISDEDYDFLLKNLETLEAEYEEKYEEIKIESVTSRVGTNIEGSNLKKENHTIPMLSLSNCYTFEETLLL